MDRTSLLDWADATSSRAEGVEANGQSGQKGAPVLVTPSHVGRNVSLSQ